MKTYLAIDLKSFYASVECVARGLDPLDTNLVVADLSRTEKTICLAVSPALKSYKIAGRARLFEVVERVKEINAERRKHAPHGKFTGKSCSAKELNENPSLGLDYIVAPPHMENYEKVGAEVFDVYQRYVSPDDIHVYSIDEVFMDVTGYLSLYRLSAHDFAGKLIRAVLEKTGVTATAGIGTNLYLCKVAMDIVAKHIPPDKDGVRIAELDERKYRELLWSHRPLTDFWRVGRGYRARLEAHGMFTMGDVARRSLEDEDLLYKLFGVNAELLIDHAWGWEPCTIAEIKSYKPSYNSLSSGQVLQEPYSFEAGRLVVKEMADSLALELVEKGLKTRQIGLHVGYDIENLRRGYHGEVVSDGYGRKVPKPVTGSENLRGYTSSSREIVAAVSKIYGRIVDEDLLVRRMYVTANFVLPEKEVPAEKAEQLDLFTDYSAREEEKRAESAAEEKEHRAQEAALSVRKKFGKNALVKGMSFEVGATARERNEQIGGHKK